MTSTRTYRSVLELERKAAARVAAADAQLERLVHDRRDVVASHARAREMMLIRPQWRSFDCYILTVHMTWVADVAAKMAAARRKEIKDRALLAGERLHWARCRVGLERRAREATTRVWLD